MGTYTWTITPNDIDREIKVWEDRNSGKLKNGWDFVAINYDSEQIINVLKYAKELNKSVLITSSYLFWKADIIYDNYSNNDYSNNNNYKKINDKSDINANEDEKKMRPLDNKEEPIAISFMTPDHSINFPLACCRSDNFSELTNKLYIEYPELKKENLLFLYNGDMIDPSVTVEQNKIKKGSIILINYN